MASRAERAASAVAVTDSVSSPTEPATDVAERVISAITALCSSTAAAMVCCRDITRSSTSSIRVTDSRTCVLSSTSWASWPAITVVAWLVWAARFLTSSATTANPRPAAPARAASMVAFRASNRVWSEMPLTVLTTWSMEALEVASRSTEATTSRTTPPASCATPVASDAELDTSFIEADICSAAEATVFASAAT